MSPVIAIPFHSKGKNISNYMWHKPYSFILIIFPLPPRKFYRATEWETEMTYSGIDATWKDLSGEAVGLSLPHQLKTRLDKAFINPLQRTFLHCLGLLWWPKGSQAQTIYSKEWFASLHFTKSTWTDTWNLLNVFDFIAWTDDFFSVLRKEFDSV